MSATFQETYERIDELVENDDHRLPRELREETWKALDERDLEILDDAATNGGGRR